MKTCKKCGTQLSDEAKFCGACGAKLDDEPGFGAWGYEERKNINSFFRDRTAEFDPEDIAANKVYGILACFGILFFIPLVAAPQSKYGKFYANQGLLLLILSIVVGIATNIVYAIFSVLGAFFWPFFLIGGLVSFVISIIPFTLLVLLLINAIVGKAVELPAIGHLVIIR